MVIALTLGVTKVIEMDFINGERHTGPLEPMGTEWPPTNVGRLSLGARLADSDPVVPVDETVSMVDRLKSGYDGNNGNSTPVERAPFNLLRELGPDDLRPIADGRPGTAMAELLDACRGSDQADTIFAQVRQLAAERLRQLEMVAAFAEQVESSPPPATKIPGQLRLSNGEADGLTPPDEAQRQILAELAAVRQRLDQGAPGRRGSAPVVMTPAPPSFPARPTPRPSTDEDAAAIFPPWGAPQDAPTP